MSNCFTTFLDSPSFSPFNPSPTHLKPFFTLRPVLPFHNLVTTTSRRRKSLNPLLLTALSSSDLDLVATTEHHDGSVIFRFGDASEIAKNDTIVEDLESEGKEGSAFVEVFDGDDEREVVSKTIERKEGSGSGCSTEVVDSINEVDTGSNIIERESVESDVVKVLDREYDREVIVKMMEREDGSGGGSSIEVADSVNEVDTDSSVVEKESDVMSVLSDSPPEPSERLLGISQEGEVFSSVSDDSLGTVAGLENAFDKGEGSAENDRNDSLDPTTDSVLDNSLSIENGVGSEEVLAEDRGNGATVQPISTKHEPNLQVPSAEVVDTKDQNVEDGMQYVKNEDSVESDIEEVMPLPDPLEAEPILDEEVSQLQSLSVELDTAMQVTHIEVMDVKEQNVDNGIQHVNVADSGASDIKDVMPLSYTLEAEPLPDVGVSHDTLEEHFEAVGIESSIMLDQDVHNSLLETHRIEGMTDSSKLTEVSGNGPMELKVTETNVNREETSPEEFFLSSGAALLAHPSKALAGGEDAYFVAGSKWLGVADGVSQWSLEGIGPGFYAKELMKNCEKIVSDSSSVPMINPVEVLSGSVRKTDFSGSPTVLIAYFDGQVLHLANIGDTGFMIIRHGAVYRKSSPMLHEFNFTLQIERGDDPSKLVEEYRIELDEGDTVVSATDGLFDNLYEQEIVTIVSKSLQAAMKPEEIAKLLTRRAQEAGRSASVRSPFADAAQAAGYIGYTGGRLDDVAVIISMVEKRSKFHAQ